jgi:hypothetical protein
MPGNLGEPVVTNSCVCFHFTREAAGALSARHSPRPYFKRGEEFRHNPGVFAPRECSSTSLRGALATKQSSFLFRRTMDCFACARNDDVARAHNLNRHHPRKRMIQYSEEMIVE